MAHGYREHSHASYGTGSPAGRVLSVGGSACGRTHDDYSFHDREHS